jgi:hypothetical protein
MSQDTQKPRGWRPAAQVLPGVKLELDHLPPTLHLEFHMGADADPHPTTEKVEEFLSVLSDQYTMLGGVGLLYHKKQTRKISSAGILCVVLYPAESGEVEVQRQRLLRVASIIKDGPEGLATHIRSHVA